MSNYRKEAFTSYKLYSEYLKSVLKPEKKKPDMRKPNEKSKANMVGRNANLKRISTFLKYRTES